MRKRAKDAEDLIEAVIRFARMLKARGVRVHSDGARTALAALAEVDILQRRDFRAVLRTTLVHRPDDLPIFDYYFNEYWGTPSPFEERRGDDPAAESPPGLNRNQPGGEQAGDEASPEDGKQRTSGLAMPQEVELAGEGILQASRAAPATITAEDAVLPGMIRTEAAELDRLARGLAPMLATRESRRWMRDPRGPSVDLRRALRGSLRYGGAPVELPRRSRRPTRTRLVIFCDVSRSMDEHAAFFLRFSAAVLRRLGRVDVFLFATDIARVTQMWLRESWASLKLRVPDCGGGTQIGACLGRFLADYESSLLNQDTIVMIFSDGLDAGDPEVLERTLASLRHRCRSIVWLNPLMHLPGYEPTARGMAVALRYIDLFSPAHDVRSLWQLIERLRTARIRRGALRDGVAEILQPAVGRA